jgi:hypothetical protein
MKVKFDGYRYLAYDEGDPGVRAGRWIPFWPNQMGKAAVAIGDTEIEKEHEIEGVYLSNCGGPKTCSALWPNPNCPECGGIGVGATFG